MQAGEVYAIDLAKVWRKVDRALKGKHAVAWCVGPADTSQMAKPAAYARLVVTDELFDEPPTKAPRKLTPRTFFHRSPNVPAIVCVPDEPPPKGVTVIGKLATLPEIDDITVLAYWAAIVMDIHYSWQREHGPPPEPAREVRKPRRLDPRKLLPGWTGPHAKVIRKLLREAIADKPTKARMRKLVDAINDYNDANRCFIETAEREDLMDILEAIAAAHGLGMMTKQLDAWRDW